MYDLELTLTDGKPQARPQHSGASSSVEVVIK